MSKDETKIAELQAENLELKAVSYWAWRRRRNADKERAQEQLKERIKGLHEHSGGAPMGCVEFMRNYSRKGWRLDVLESASLDAGNGSERSSGAKISRLHSF